MPGPGLVPQTELGQTLPDLAHLQRDRRLGQQVENHREGLLGEDGVEQPGVGQSQETQRTPRRDVNASAPWDKLFLIGVIPLDLIVRPIIREDRSGSGSAYAERIGHPDKTLICAHECDCNGYRRGRGAGRRQPILARLLGRVCTAPAWRNNSDRRWARLLAARTDRSVSLSLGSRSSVNVCPSRGFLDALLARMGMETRGVPARPEGLFASLHLGNIADELVGR
ncbi:hypothetical protein GCM10020358_18680 [Amorphoplanes nipponensis]|uniref:Uncharacterized protein n=1 Tax=Actinoplanes nipponensis TaxID=135950 RepID=A0A919MN13_9ACTN|nr:hypothetical protein Ani05nite_40160 [Actinoplanes nipponensis]